MTHAYVIEYTVVKGPTGTILAKESRQVEVEKLLEEIYQYFEDGNFQEAQRLLKLAHAMDYEDNEIQTAMRICGFWMQRLQKVNELTGEGSQGDYLRRMWTVFEQSYRKNTDHPLEEVRARLKIWVNSQALHHYRSHVKELNEPQSMFQAGRCLKALGRFEEAALSFESALKKTSGTDVRCMAELADTYALVGELKLGKIMMREALFLDASKVELHQLKAPVFVRLIESLENEHSGDSRAFNEWLPVYGVLWGVLDIKRELSPVKSDRLKQIIYSLKSELADGDENGTLTPKLINRYFRLIDHYQITDINSSGIEDVLLNIKLLSPTIYDKYLK